MTTKATLSFLLQLRENPQLFPLRLLNSTQVSTNQTTSSSSLPNYIMDFDFRASTIYSSNHFPSLQAARLHSENYSVLNYTDGDDDTLPLLRCHFCEFDIEFSVLRDHSVDVHSFDPKNMVCPVCEENLGDDAIKAAQMLSSRKRNWKSEKYSTSSGNSAMLDKKHAAWGNRHEPMSDPLLSLGNVFVPRVSDIQSSPSDFQSDEDSISVASDISIAKSSGTDAPDSGDEQGREERNMRAAFAQELVLSTLFLE